MDMNALGTRQEALKSDICAELRSDMCNTKADFMAQVPAMEDKMGSLMSAIREELLIQIGDLHAGQAELEERLKKQKHCHHFSGTTSPEPAGRIRGPAFVGLPVDFFSNRGRPLFQ